MLISHYIKLFIILFLFIINIYLIIIHEPIGINNNSSLPNASNAGERGLESGFGNRNIRNILIGLGTLGANLSAYITIKNEFKEQKIDRLGKARDDILNHIENDKNQYEIIREKVSTVRDELIKLHIERTKIYAQNDRLSVLEQAIKKDISIYKEKSALADTRLSDLINLSDNINRNLENFSTESESIIEIYENDNIDNNNPSSVGDDNNLKESNILNIDLTKMREWFDSLEGIKQLSVGLILGKSVILSALISIIFIFYGNILIEKYNLENNYPRIWKIIQLRQKYQKYYFNLNCLLIFIIVLSELMLGISILSL